MSRGRPPISARTLIVSLYGAFVRQLGGWIAVADLLDLLGQLGVEQQVGRSAITRMKRSGQLIAETVDGRPGYRAGEELAEILAEGDTRLFASTATATLDQGWLIVVFTVPESQRDRRHVLRTRLAALGCGALAPGVFIAPRRAAADVRRMLHMQRLDRFVSMFSGQYLGPADVEHLARDVWGSARQLELDYRSFIEQHSSATADTNGEAFRRYVALLEDWRHLTYRDPGLPDALSPAAESRNDATILFHRARAALSGAALAHVAGVTAEVRR